MERLAFTRAFAATGGSLARSRASSAEVPAASAAADVRIERQDVLAYRGLLAFTLVLFIRPQDSLPVLHAFHLGDVTAIFALVALAAGRMRRGAPLIRLTPELNLVLAFGAVILVTAPFSLWPGGAVAIFMDLYSKVILIFALIVNTLTTRARIRTFVGIVVVGTSYIGVRAVLDYARGVNLVEGGRVTGAVDGLFGNPNDMALNMVAFLPLAVVGALQRGRSVLRVLALVGVPAITAAIIFSKSRGGAVGLIGMLIVFLYHLRRSRPMVAALVVVASIAAVPTLPSSFTDRMSSIFNPAEDPTGSREARKLLMREAYQAFLDNPVVGLGAGQFPNYRPYEREVAWRETHNAVLQAAAELGVTGLLVFLAMIGSGFVAVHRVGTALRRRQQARRRPKRGALPSNDDFHQLYAAALFASLTGWLLAAMFASVAYYWTLYIVLGLVAAHRDIAVRELHVAARRSGNSAAAKAA